eukprot:3961541-Ditylum_brightwellii.AAC.1
MAMAGTIHSFPKEKAIVLVELSSHMYRTLPYFFAKPISEIPLIGMLTTMFGCIIYPLTGLQKGIFQSKTHHVACDGLLWLGSYDGALREHVRKKQLPKSANEFLYL